MFELDECLKISKMLADIEEYIIELKYRTMYPKIQVVSDMPKGGGKQINEIESYLIKLEKLDERKKFIQFDLDVHWCIALEALGARGVTDMEAIQLMKYRFYFGLPWKKCLKRMQEEYTDSKWTINKCFSTYRSILYKKKRKI